jgi:hypothetical protein
MHSALNALRSTLDDGVHAGEDRARRGHADPSAAVAPRTEYEILR